MFRRVLCAAAAAGVMAALSASLCSAQDKVPLNSAWKFITGDNLDYARPGFDDSRWKSIRVDKSWEDQGYDPYDGFAWYRLHIIIPVSLRDRARLKDGLRIHLGKINNFDQSFLNGHIIGINGKLVPDVASIDNEYTKADPALWDLDRVYVLPFDDQRILWGKENVIAVRVFDEGGWGGMFSGDQDLRPVGFRDYVSLDYVSEPFVFLQDGLKKTVRVSNSSKTRVFQGTLTANAVSAMDGREVWRQDYQEPLQAGSKRAIEVVLPRLDQSCLITYEFASPQDGDHWAFHESTPYILTPAPRETPRLTGARIVGERPGKPFLHSITATGRKPIVFSGSGLPPGLMLDSGTGIITGRASKAGEYRVNVSAKNALGADARELRIVIGDNIALTPPIGWNSWNAWGLSVDAEKVKASARVYVEKGLRDHGWTYINIDDGWEIKGDDPRAKRDATGRIITNEKFPDMKALGDAIHAMGLKFGIYSSPGPLTCGGYTASYQYEDKDAESYAGWGIDYLKYDWCSYDKIAKDRSLTELKQPYLLMRKNLDAAGRDIVFSLCQYGMGKVWEWGAGAGGNLWRTTDDITDTWESMSKIGFGQTEEAAFAGPGHWNDPDMLVVGWVGWGPSLHPTRLSPDEQYTHISLWSLLAAPLLIGCDLERLDPFTLNLLTNDEVLAVDQDPLGKQAVPVAKSGDIQVWARNLEGGSKAVGAFNLGSQTAAYMLDPSAVGIKDAKAARDLWRQKNLQWTDGKLSLHVPAHGVVLLRLSR